MWDSGGGRGVSLMKLNAIFYVHVHFPGEGDQSSLSAFQSDSRLPKSMRNPCACVMFGLSPHRREGMEESSGFTGWHQPSAEILSGGQSLPGPYLPVVCHSDQNFPDKRINTRLNLSCSLGVLLL